MLNDWHQFCPEKLSRHNQSRFRTVEYDRIPAPDSMFYSELHRYVVITVSYARKLTSVSMRYSQGDGFNASLSRFIRSRSVPSIFLFGVCGYLPWHGHMLPGTKVIKIMCVLQLYQQG